MEERFFPDLLNLKKEARMKSRNMRQEMFAAIACSVGIAGVYYVKRQDRKKQARLKNRILVLSDHFQLLNHWMEIKSEGKHIGSYFEEMGYHHIAIYGMAELANRLSEELADSAVTIDYGIDRDAACTIARIAEIYNPEDDLPQTDAIIVTPYSVFDEIKDVLEKKVDCPIISLEEVVWSV